ncbi:MAG: hypothetical protein JNK82_21095, partial [Myxococcaceae bacterium]|nr:hypothetical protein [Myxococcaceae bacterium]
MRALLLTLTLTASALAAAGEPVKHPELEKAQKALASKKYADALKLLDAAEKKGGLDVDSYATLLESRALALASTKKVDQATTELKKLLALDPRRDLAGKYKGDVVKALDAALAWVAQAGGNQLVALDPEASGGKVKKVSVQVKNDPLSMVKAVRINVRDGNGWRPVDAAPAGGIASADTDAAEVEFWAEAWDDKKNQVETLGSAIRPITQTAPVAVAAAEKPKAVEKAAPVADAPKESAQLTPADKEPETNLVEEPAPKKNVGLRAVSYALIGAGIITAGVGTYFGVSSQSARSQ